MNKTKRVLHSWNGMNIGGIETFIMNVYRNIDREKVQFDFLINHQAKCSYEDEIVSLGGIVHRVPVRHPNFLKHLIGMNRFFKNNRYEILHQHATGNDIAPNLIIAKKYGVKNLICHSHNSKSSRKYINGVFKFLYRRRFKKLANHYFACSDLAAQNVFGKYIDESKIKIINNAINTEDFIYNESIREAKRREFSLGDKFVIGHIGRFVKAKNHSFVIDIFIEILKKMPNAVLMLIGDGPLREEVEAKIKSRGLQDNVIMTGMRTDVPDLLQAIDTFVFPSFYEGFPVTLVEAQTIGLPCFVSDSITKQIKITEMTEYISLDEKPEYWCDRILKCAAEYKRRSMRDEVTKAGFDIKELTNWMQNFYLSI